MTYQNKAFCASKVKTHTCGRELTVKDELEVIFRGEYISWGYFCETPTPESSCCSAGIVDGRCADCKEILN
jgi:hypothetical protein